MHAWASASSASIDGVTKQWLWAGQVIRYSTALFKFQLICPWCCTTRTTVSQAVLEFLAFITGFVVKSYWNQNKISPEHVINGPLN